MLQRLNDSGAELWHEEIQQCIDKANNIAEEAEKRESIQSTLIPSLIS